MELVLFTPSSSQLTQICSECIIIPFLHLVFDSIISPISLPALSSTSIFSDFTFQRRGTDAAVRRFLRSLVLTPVRLCVS